MIENTLEIPVEKNYDIEIRVTHPNPSLFREGLIDRINFLLITLTRFQMLKSYMTISLSLVRERLERVQECRNRTIKSLL